MYSTFTCNKAKVCSIYVEFRGKKEKKKIRNSSHKTRKGLKRELAKPIRMTNETTLFSVLRMKKKSVKDFHFFDIDIKSKFSLTSNEYIGFLVVFKKKNLFFNSCLNQMPQTFLEKKSVLWQKKRNQ